MTIRNYIIVILTILYSSMSMANPGPFYHENINLKQDLHFTDSLKKNIIELKNGIPQAHKWEQLKREVSRNDLFEEYSPWISQIDSLLKESKNNTFFKKCIQVAQDQKNTTLSNITQEYCVHKILQTAKADIDKHIAPDDFQISLIMDYARPTDKLRSFVISYLNLIQKKSHNLYQIKKSAFFEKKIGLTTENGKIVSTEIFIKNSLSQLIKKRKNDPHFKKNISASLARLKTISSDLTTENWLEITRLGKILSQDKEAELSKEFFIFTVEHAQSQIAKDDAIFEIIWSSCQSKNYHDAVQFIEKMNLEQSITKSESQKLKFWTALSFFNSNQKEKANLLFNRIIELDPFSYYSVMSIKTLGKNFSSHVLNKKVSTSGNYTEVESELKKYKNNFLRIWLWAKIDFRLMLSSEHAQLLKIPAPLNEAALYHSYKIMGQAQNHLASFSFLNNDIVKGHIKFNRELLDIMFPKLFWDEMATHLKGQDPLVLISLIRQESGFNPNAKSQVGARGLMQLMPYTAKILDRRIASTSLQKPETNLKLGITFFKMMMDKFDNNLVYVLSAYNAGPQRVIAWQKEHFDLDDSILHNIESIPFMETRNYVKLIFRNIFYYKMMHTKDVGQDPISFNKIFDVHLGFKH